MSTPVEIAPARGKLGVLLVGLGAVATTTIAGVMAIRKGLASPIGSLTQMGTIRLGKRTEGRSPKINEIVPLASLDDIVFVGWDIFEEDCYTAAKTAGVLEPYIRSPIWQVRSYAARAARTRIGSGTSIRYWLNFRESRVSSRVISFICGQRTLHSRSISLSGLEATILSPIEHSVRSR